MRRASTPPIPPSALAVAGLLTFGVVSCDRGPESPYFGTTDRTGKDPATFYVNNGNEPEYLDPGSSSDAASAALILQLFEGLTAYHPEDLRPTPGVAVRWDESDDKRRLRFYLRPDAKWSDGLPVTARDFEYAWKRVLRPRTASRAAPNLYPLKNGEIFNRGKLKTAAQDLRLRAEPREGSAIAATLPKGEAVLVLASSPMALASSIRPLPRVPEGISSVLYTKSPESLAFGAERVTPNSSQNQIKIEKGAEVSVVGRAAPVECNGAPDSWFTVEIAGERGVLPGCMLAEPKSKKQFLLVERFTDLPAFGEPKQNDRPDSPSGFVLESEITSDDAVLGVRATDDLTLDIELEQPTPYFTDLTSHPTLYPVRKDLIEEFERRGQPDLWSRPENMISNGPYILDTWKFRYEITMKRNPHYWDRENLRIHRIVWLEVEDYRSTMNLYKAGEIDFIGDNVSLPAEYMDLLSTKRDFLRFPILSTYWFDLNTRKPPTDDVRVRRALNLAIDKREIVERITRAGQIPATHIVPDFTGGGYAEQAAADRAAGTDPFVLAPDLQHDPERARALLAEAGHPVVKDGDGYRASNFPPLEILYNTNEGHRHIAIAVQSMWKRHLGVSATLRNEEWKVMLKSVRDGHFQVARGGMGANYNHPHTFLDLFLSYSPQNATGWADKEFDTLIKAALAAPDRKESIRLYRKAEERAVAGMSKIPLYFYTKSTLIKPWVKGYYGTVRMVHLVKWLWIDEAWRQNPENRPAFTPLPFPEPGRLP
ncbi:MAG: peptide ABC transporter substrate-binding protein [Polyangiaceae bacterium]|nr:peptide ABC transporter substrate-binding protein [Polyangiaceae bacterium]